MVDQNIRWLEQIIAANEGFTERIRPEKMPVERTPGPAVITCMDPRVNLGSIGIPGFTEEGEGSSLVRIIRTLGGMADNRSLIVGIFLAGFREIVLVMHTDCGCCLAYSKIDTIVENMHKRLPPERLERFKSEVGEPFPERLRAYLKAFEDPREAIKQEIECIRQTPFVPDDVVLHGLLYELETGRVEVIVDGYA